MKTASDELARLKKVLLTDALKIPNGVLSVLKNDIKNVLNSYFDLIEDSLNIAIEVDEKGVYNIQVGVKCSNAKKVKSF